MGRDDTRVPEEAPCAPRSETGDDLHSCSRAVTDGSLFEIARLVR